MHVGLHEEPLAREAEHGDATPLVMPAAALHGFGEHAAVSDSVPALHDLELDRV